MPEPTKIMPDRGLIIAGLGVFAICALLVIGAGCVTEFRARRALR
ncbi:hypothetical protein [Streptomyces sp. NPDC005799]